jgi:hypothetical protein
LREGVSGKDCCHGGKTCAQLRLTGGGGFGLMGLPTLLEHRNHLFARINFLLGLGLLIQIAL